MVSYFLLLLLRVNRGMVWSRAAAVLAVFYDGLHKNRRGRNYMLNFLALDYLGMPLALILDPFGVSG
jgi:hypothetical protein